MTSGIGTPSAAEQAPRGRPRTEALRQGDRANRAARVQSLEQLGRRFGLRGDEEEKPSATNVIRPLGTPINCYQVFPRFADTTARVRSAAARMSRTVGGDPGSQPRQSGAPLPVNIGPPGSQSTCGDRRSPHAVRTGGPTQLPLAGSRQLGCSGCQERDNPAIPPRNTPSASGTGRGRFGKKHGGIGGKSALQPTELRVPCGKLGAYKLLNGCRFRSRRKQ